MINDFNQTDDGSSGGDDGSRCDDSSRLRRAEGSSDSFHDDDDYDDIDDDDDSQEPYYHVSTGRVVTAREAWSVLAREGHPKFRTRGGGGGGGGGVFRPRGDGAPSRNNDDAPTLIGGSSSPSWPPPGEGGGGDEDSEGSSSRDIHNVLSYSSGPTQSTIDRALHPESPNYISPNRDLRQIYKKASSYEYPEGVMMDGGLELNSEDNLVGGGGGSAEAVDPIVERAKAMALAAQNGQKLTPEQMQLIAQPDVQQQKLIEEAKRVQRSKEMQAHSSQQAAAPFQQASANLQRIGDDLKKFIQTEKEKPPMQWGADLGKFIESQGLRMSSSAAAAGGGQHGAQDGGPDSPRDDAAGGGDGGATRHGPSPTKRKVMEGFGSDPAASPRSEGNTPSATGGGGGVWPQMKMPPLPLVLGENISNILPGAAGRGDNLASAAADAVGSEPVKISGVLWKRRSGFGKHSAIKAWERRRVELRGSRLVYYQSAEERKEEGGGSGGGGGGEKEASSGPATPRADSDPDNAASEPYVKKSSLGIFGQAAQAAEMRIQNARDELTRLANVTGLSGAAGADAPRGVLDLVREGASVSASMGHSDAPTPFCLSVKVKSVKETKWKFCFDTQAAMMEWLSAMTDVIVRASVDGDEGGKPWEVEEYCIRRRRRSGDGTQEEDGEADVASPAATVTRAASFVQSAASAAASFSADDEAQWMILGTNLYIAWGLINVAFVLARASSTSIEQYWNLVVFVNFVIWQLCRRPEVRRRNAPAGAPTRSAVDADAVPVTKSIPKKNYKPIAGSTAARVNKEDEPGINKKGNQVSAWMPIQPSALEVRSHGYLTTKRKIPCPAELYECVAADCFVSDNRYPGMAPRVKFGEQFIFPDQADKTWKSPDIFIASIAIPTEAPRFGQSTDDGPGVTVIGYFRMKEETRAILKRITAPGYNPAADSSDSGTDVQRRVTNGVRLWERYCNEAPGDPSFQARFKLIPAGNAEEIGCPSYIAKYNGKPVLIKRNQVTGFFNDYPALSAMEFEINFHPFPYLFKQAMAYLKDYFDKSMWTFGFVIEGRCDEELPEVMIGAMKLRPKLPGVIGEEFFAGTCSKCS